MGIVDPDPLEDRAKALDVFFHSLPQCRRVPLAVAVAELNEISPNVNRAAQVMVVLIFSEVFEGIIVGYPSIICCKTPIF